VWPATAVSAHANAGNASLSPAHVSGGGTTRRAAMPRIEAGALIGTLLLSATAVWLAPIVQPPELASAQVLIELTWPAVAGAVAAVLIARSAALRGWPRAPAVPPGDLGVPIA